MKINQNLPKVELYSDGGARPNPGPGAYGVILKLLKKNTNSSGLLKEFSGFEKNTTNNRMELTGVIVGLSKLKEKCDVQVFTDSSYVVNGIEKGWVKKWKENNWMRTKSEKATNYDLWEKLLNLIEKHDVKFNWIKGHNGHKENERCDEIATNQILKNSHLFSNVEGESKSSPQPSPEGEGVGEENLGEIRKVGIVENYGNVPSYVMKLSRELRQKQTSFEKIMWEVLRDRRLNNLKFRRQYAFGRYIADFYCFEKDLVIELDGKIHEKQLEYDNIRDEIISKYKIRILRIKNEEIFNNLQQVIQNILFYSSPLGEVRGGQKGEIQSSPQPSPKGEGVGEEGVGKKRVEKEIDISGKQKKIKVKKPGDKCRKCSDIVIKSIPKKKNTTNKNYYYDYYLTCQNCKTNYFVDEAKVFINKLDI